METHAPDSSPNQSDQAAVRKVLWITLTVNITVAIVQLGYGYWSDIVSLQADGFHTTFDALANIIGLVALGVARRPPDVEHPYGHEKFEVAASLVIGIMVLLGFIEIGRAVWTATAQDLVPTITPLGYGLVIGTVVVNLGVSAWEHREGQRLDSMILQSDAAHTFSDSLTTGSVLIGMYLVDVGFPVGDTLAALAVMLFIGMTAYRVLREGLDVLVDSSFLDPRDVQSCVEELDEVQSCHYVRSRGMPGYIHVDLHLSLDPELSLRRAGEIMNDVKARLHGQFPDVEDVLVQLEPHVPEHVEDVPEQLV